MTNSIVMADRDAVTIRDAMGREQKTNVIMWGNTPVVTPRGLDYLKTLGLVDE